MWIPRTPEEVAKWHTATVREARSAGWLIAGLSWLGITALLAGGWIVGGRAGFITENSVAAGSFWSRFPVFAIAGLPVVYWLLRRESARELQRAVQMTICPKCEATGEGNADTPCQCGGSYVRQSTVRWIDDEPSTPTGTPKES
jgi:hypothetical protein